MNRNRRMIVAIKNSVTIACILLLATTCSMVNGKNSDADVAIKSYEDEQVPYIAVPDGDISGIGDAVMIPGQETDVTADVEIVEKGEIEVIVNEPEYAPKSYDKVRVIAMTDGEGDDRCSMVRFLLYSNEMDIEAIIQTNSYYQVYGHSKNTGELWLEQQIEAYGFVINNLRVHDPSYPSEDFLMSRLYIGDEDPDHVVKGSSEAKPPFKNSEGSNRIIEVLLDDTDSRPVWVQSWGGTNTVAQALYELKYSGNYSNAEYKEAAEKLRIHAISYQDDSGAYIEEHFPEVLVVKSYAFAETWGYQNEQGSLLGTSWVDTYLEDHGALSERYPKSSVYEGDTPSYLNAVMNGLRASEHPTYGGWGGQFYKEATNLYFDLDLNTDRDASIRRYIEPAQNDFAARLDWCRYNLFAGANHHPVIITDTESDLKVFAGQNITIDASYSYDPDGDELIYSWQINEDAGTNTKSVHLSGESSSKVTITIPSSGLSGKTIHVILTLTDQNELPLTKYERYIITIQ